MTKYGEIELKLSEFQGARQHIHESSTPNKNCISMLLAQKWHSQQLHTANLSPNGEQQLFWLRRHAHVSNKHQTRSVKSGGQNTDVAFRHSMCGQNERAGMRTLTCSESAGCFGAAAAARLQSVDVGFLERRQRIPLFFTRRLSFGAALEATSAMWNGLSILTNSKHMMLDIRPNIGC